MRPGRRADSKRPMEDNNLADALSGVEHRDSMGFRDQIGPGDAQWIRVGRGILHAEKPTGPRHGLQLWTSLPPDQKFAEPAYGSWRAADLPQLDLKGGAGVVLAGRVRQRRGTNGPSHANHFDPCPH
jgi:redox-sensitive bicupin YhaK (pirin superfamily)